MAEMVEFFKLSYYSYRGGKKLRQTCSATCIYRTVFELKNILASIGLTELPNSGCTSGSTVSIMQIYFCLSYGLLDDSFVESLIANITYMWFFLLMNCFEMSSQLIWAKFSNSINFVPFWFKDENIETFCYSLTQPCLTREPWEGHVAPRWYKIGHLFVFL